MHIQISNNEERFEVPLKVAQISSFVKDVLAEDCEYDEGADRNVYCLKVSGLILKKVVEFCTHYASPHSLVIHLRALSNKNNTLTFAMLIEKSCSLWCPQQIT